MQLPQPVHLDEDSKKTKQTSYQATTRRSYDDLDISPIVTPLFYSHVGKASKSWVDAFERDPFLHYMIINREGNSGWKSRMRFTVALRFIYRIRTSIALTVDEGAALITCSPPKLDSKSSYFNRVIGWFLLDFPWMLILLFSTPEERKRIADVNTKIEQAVQRSLGTRIDDMFYISTLATEPASQGYGYATALLKSIHALADSTHRAIWLESNEKNSVFYKKHGYRIIDEAIIGEDNPNWHGPPFIVKIMVREPHERQD